MTQTKTWIHKTVSLTEDTINYVQKFADDHGTNFSEALRFLLHHNQRGRIMIGVPATLIRDAYNAGIDIPHVVRFELERQLMEKRREQKVLKARAAMCNNQE